MAFKKPAPGPRLRPWSELSGTAQGIALMIATMFFFSVLDAMAKEVAHRTDTVMAIWARYAGQTVVVSLLIATSCFFFGFVTIGLANAAAIMSINPILITLGAALILGERFGPRRAFGVGAALVGALIIIRPGSQVFSAAALLPVGAALAYSGYALTTRFVGRDEDPWTSLFYTAAFGTVVLSLIVPFFWLRPDPLAAVLMMALGSFGALGHFCLIRALMAAEASAIAPFSYVGLLFATVWGMVIFGEYPDLFTYLGALVIAVAGIYVWHREIQTARATAPGE